MSNTPHETLIIIDKVELDLWADIYCKARLASLIDVTLSEFLLRPYDFLKESGQASALDCLENGFFPMMPAQVKVSQDLQRSWEGGDTRCSGLMKPDTHLGENARQIEVSDDQTKPFLFC